MTQSNHEGTSGQEASSGKPHAENPNPQGETSFAMPDDTMQSAGDSQGTPDVKALEAEVARLQAEGAEWQDKYLRLAAETENVRRRHEKERTELLKYGNEDLIKDLLPALDGFEKALAAAERSPELSPFLSGFTLLQKQLLEALERKGLKVVPTVGAPFDPNVHQAIQRVDSPDVAVDTVGQEFAKGYLLNDRLIRAAMVSVLVPAGNTKG